MLVSKVPLRISFFGGGTDFPKFYNKYGGAVISGPLNKCVHVIISDDFDGKIKLSYSSREELTLREITSIKHPLLRETLRIYKKHLTPIEITSIADVTKHGTGLGSSSAFTVALIRALDEKYGINRGYDDIARLACNIEIERCRSPIGIQDQWAASIGRLSHIRFSKKVKVFCDGDI